MSAAAQISAAVSPETKRQLDEFAERYGLKKTFVVEQALLLYMAARRELPDEAFVPSRIVLSGDSFGVLADALEQPASATPDLRRLMRGD